MSDINLLQTNIMVFVHQWANTEKTPIPQRQIVENMSKQGIKTFTTLNAINALLKKGYLRKGYSEKQNVTVYVMTRSI